MAYTFTLDTWDKERLIKHIESGFATLSPVPDTAEGYEKTRCYYTNTNEKARTFISANSEKDYFINYEHSYNGFSVWFRIEGDTITIDKAVYKGRTLRSANNLKQFVNKVTYFANGIINGNIVEWIA